MQKDMIFGTLCKLKLKNMTATEWLFKELWECDKDKFTWHNIFEQAKEMEKQQIMDAFWNGDNSDCTSEQNSKEFAQKYYNETYGSKGSDECHFEQTTNTSSATICKHCGKEKFLHKQ